MFIKKFAYNKLKNIINILRIKIEKYKIVNYFVSNQKTKLNINKIFAKIKYYIFFIYHQSYIFLI